MIEAITVRSCASYDDEGKVVSPLLACNYFFGFNGTGKSTIARLVGDPQHEDFACSSVQWRDNQPLDVLVYNREFVAEHFDDADELRGVFTLGKDSKEAKARIREKKDELSRLNVALADSQDKLEMATHKLAAVESELAETCWKKVQPRKSSLRGALEGHIGGKEDFKSALLGHRRTPAELRDRSYLDERVATAFAKAPERRSLIPVVSFEGLLSVESNPLLSTKIVGSEDVPVAELIEKLQNQDWVRRGQAMLAESDGKCPFCQRTLQPGLEADLNAFFDDTYLKRVDEVAALVSEYRQLAAQVHEALDLIAATGHESLDAAAFDASVSVLRSEVEANIERLEAKYREPSRVSELKPLGVPTGTIDALITAANIATREHNKTVDNIETVRKATRDEVWKYLVDVELKVELDTHSRKKTAAEGEIRDLQASIREMSELRDGLESQIRGLESQVTDVRKVLHDINRLLTSFGFTGFSLEATPEGRAYRLVRPDGKPAKENLSEGERSFVTFLYFYHLIEGSLDESGMTSDRVVVFDDPVSSMDSEVLFIVSTLIRRVCDQATSRQSHIKQVFLFTHNVYFHKEVTYHRHRATFDTFWVVRKPGGRTEVEGHGKANPVRTSYQMLWDELIADELQPATVKNNIRRILEHYFYVHGNVSVNSLPEYFDDDDPDKLVCHSFVSMIHDGSHSIDDDIVFSSSDPAAVHTYLRVLVRIFEQAGQINHLKLMSPSLWERHRTEESEEAPAARSA